MKKKLAFIFVLALCMALLCIGAGATAGDGTNPFAVGNGTADSPYIIMDADELAAVGNELNAHYKLGGNIDLNNNSWTPIGSDDNHAFTGTFDGGNHTISGLYIDSSSEYAGLFGYVSGAGTVKNLTVSGTVTGNGNYTGGIVGWNNGTVSNCTNNVNVTGNGSGAATYTGGVVGYNYGSTSTVSDCTNAGTVSGSSNRTGGVVGLNEGSVTNCDNTGTVSGSEYDTGGVVGLNAKGTVTNCYNTGVVNGGRFAGGVVGYNYGSTSTVTNSYNTGTVSNCYNTGAIRGGGFSAGGVVGMNASIATIESCYNTGNVDGTGVHTGGVAGCNASDIDTGVAITNSYNTGAVTGSTYTGGIVGSNSSSISNCYNTGDVTGGSTTGGVVGYNYNISTGDIGTVSNCYNTGAVTGSGNTGGVVGRNIGSSSNDSNTATVKNCYNTGTVSGSGNTGGVAGENGSTVENCYYLDSSADKGIGTGTNSGATSQCREYFGYIDKFTGWGNDDTWIIFNAGGDDFARPMLQENMEAGGGSGTEDDPYLIPSLDTLKYYRDKINANSGYRSAHYKLTANIELGGSEDTQWTPIGSDYNHAFTGTFDGDRYTISELCIINSSSDYVGLFGYVGADGTVKNLTVSGTVTGRVYYTGGIVGRNNGTVSNCTNNVNVTGNSAYTGGVVGRNDYGTVVNCYNTGTVSGGLSTGGVVGDNFSGTVSNCYNTGAVREGLFTGGVVGNNTGYVSNCYNTGTVTATGSNTDYIGGVVGNNSSGNVTNCYYLNTSAGKGFGGIGTATTKVESKTTEQFASGEVAWRLQYGQETGSGQVWGQTLSGDNKDSYPVLTDEQNAMVVSVTFNVNGESGTYAVKYTNYNGTVTFPPENPTPPEGQVFDGWYSGGTKYENDAAFTEDTTLTARFAADTVPVTGVTLDENSLALQVGETHALTATVVPENADNKNVTWTSSDTSVATVSESGLVTAIGEGTATITVTTEDGSFTATCTVTVTPLPTYTVRVNGSYAEVTGAGSYLEGASVTVSAGERTGYRFAGWTAEGITLTDANAETVTFNMPDNDVALTAAWDRTSNPGNPTYKPIVEEPENGGVTTTPTRPEAGDTVTVNPEPDEGYEVDEIIVTDEDGNAVEVTRNPDGSYSFTQPEGAVTIEITFRPVGESGLPFTDVTEGDWFYGCVEYVYENGLMDGVSDTTFEPNGEVTRAQLVTILWRLDGEPVVNYLLSFTDVESGEWYTEAVRWAASEGIVEGVSDTEFAPNAPVTREQFAAILYRYAQYKGMDVVTLEENLNGFSDNSSISSYAVQAMNWSVGQGILTGVTDATLEPQGTATRAQCAAMLMRFVENVK